MKSIRDAEVAGKRVLVRCDFNVAFDDHGNIEDDFRMRAALPTFRVLLSQGAKLVVASHFGRSKNKLTAHTELESIRMRVEQLLKIPVRYTLEPLGDEMNAVTHNLACGEVLLLDNIRSFPGEEKNDLEFARQLSLLGDIYVNEAFSACHRAHASIALIPQFLPSYAGSLLEKEVTALSQLVENPARPLVVLVGGSKVDTKASFVDSVSEVADTVLLGNLLANAITETGTKFVYEKKIVKPVDGLPGNGKEFDVGPCTIELFAERIKNAKTIFWSGPMGKTEKQEYSKGSIAIADMIVRSGAYCVAGGGDLNAFLKKYNFIDRFSYVSTGGGAMLAFLAKKKLPGLEALGYYAE